MGGFRNSAGGPDTSLAMKVDLHVHRLAQADRGISELATRAGRSASHAVRDRSGVEYGPVWTGSRSRRPGPPPRQGRGLGGGRSRHGGRGSNQGAAVDPSPCRPASRLSTSTTPSMLRAVATARSIWAWSGTMAGEDDASRTASRPRCAVPLHVVRREQRSFHLRCNRGIVDLLTDRGFRARGVNRGLRRWHPGRGLIARGQAETA